MKAFWLTPFILGALCSAQEVSVTLDEAVRLALDRHEDIGKAHAAADGSEVVPRMTLYMQSMTLWRLAARKRQYSIGSALAEKPAHFA
jgi:hypothetical protein